MAVAPDVLLAVVGELQNREIVAAKTKLLKLLYLVDIEHFRSTGRILTGWRWIFHHFGPWANEYDPLLQQLADRGRVQLEGTAADAILVRGLDQRVDASLVDDVDGQMAIGRVLTRWADVDLPRLLDFVYFETEPMRSAARGDSLSFAGVTRGAYPVYRRATSDPREVKAMRARLAERLEKEGRPPGLASMAVEPKVGYGAGKEPQYTPPVYDREVLAALASMEDD